MADLPSLRWQVISRSAETAVARQIRLALTDDVVTFVEAQSSPTKIRDLLLRAHETSELGPRGLFALERLLEDLGPAQRLAALRRELEAPVGRDSASDKIRHVVRVFGANVGSTPTEAELEVLPGLPGVYPVGGLMPALAERQVDRIVAKLGREGSDQQATALLQLAGAPEREDVRAALRPFLSHALEYRRAFAAQTLGLIGDQQSFARILGLLPLESACPLDEDRHVASEALAIGLACLAIRGSPKQRAELRNALERLKFRIYGPARGRLAALMNALGDGSG